MRLSCDTSTVNGLGLRFLYSKGACPIYFGNYKVIVTLGGEGVKGHDVINYNLWAGKTLHVAILTDSRYG